MVVECQRQLAHRVDDRPEPGGGGVRTRAQAAGIGSHREIGHRDHVGARIAAGIAVGTELRQMLGRDQPGLLTQFPPRGLVERLVRPLESAG